MSADGADQGVGAKRALGTILGGEPQPTDEEKESIAEMRACILAAPIEAAESYDGCATACARLILELYERYPELVDYPTESIYVRDEQGRPVGIDAEPFDGLQVLVPDLHEVLKRLHPEDSPGGQVLLELTGFMWGWAVNAARRCVGAEARPNPAILTIG